MERLVESFWLYSESGFKQRAAIYQESVDTSSMNEKSSLDTFKNCRLNDGSPLNYVDDNTYKDVLGNVLTRIPHAK